MLENSTACVGRVLMAEHQVESAPFGHVSTAKQATFQVAPRFVGHGLEDSPTVVVNPHAYNNIYSSA